MLVDLVYPGVDTLSAIGAVGHGDADYLFAIAAPPSILIAMNGSFNFISVFTYAEDVFLEQAHSSGLRLRRETG